MAMADECERRSEADGGVPAAAGAGAEGRGVVRGEPLPTGRPSSSSSFHATVPSSTLSLRRNPSVASSHDHSSGRSNVPAPSGGGSAATAFPASPAVSTLSKNSSSGGSSYSSAAAAARMSVDDILRNSKSSLGARRRSKMTAPRASGSGAESTRPPATTPSALPLSSSSRPTSVAVAPTEPLCSGRRPRRPDEGGPTAPNPGQEERMRRLERIQMEKLRRRRRSGPPVRSRSSLERLKAMSDEGAEEGAPSGEGGLGRSCGGGSILAEPAKEPDATENVGGGVPTEEGERDERSKPTPRRSRRAKAVISYNVAELARTRGTSVANMSKAASLKSSKSSPIAVVSTQTEGQSLRDGSISAKSQIADKEDEAAKEEEQEEEEEDAPESADSALAILLSKYDTCVNGSSSSQGENGKVVVSPWSAVQPLLSVLQHVNLNDPDVAKSEECGKVERGLATIVASIERVKYDVMNRDSRLSPIDQDQHGEGEEGEAGKEARLLLIIQIQVWIRMMVWMLEHEAGWEFLTRVIALSDAQPRSVVDDVEDEEMRKKKDRKKKKNKKKPKDKVGQMKPGNIVSSPEQHLVDDVKSLLELAPFVLPRSVDFSQWIRATLTFGFRQTVPKYAVELFDHFEIDATEPITLKRCGTDASQQSKCSDRLVSHSPVKMPVGSGETCNQGGTPMKQLAERRHERQRAYFASLAEENAGAADDESATITGSVSTVTSASRNSRNSLREKDDALLFRTSLSLTSEHSGRSSSNPFLKGTARGEYVGSHLGSKLSNITSLFREVKAPPRPKLAPKPVAVSKTKGLPVDWQGDSVTAGKTLAAARQQANPGSRGARTRLLPSSPPKETPRKRPHAASTSSLHTSVPPHAFAETPRPVCAVAETPLLKGAVVETPMPTVDETPARRLPRVRPRTGGSILDSIVEETPQQPPTTRNDGPASSAVMPTNLWRAPSQPMQPWLVEAPVSRRREKIKGIGKVDHANGTGESHYALSPMPHGEDVAIVSQAAKAAAARKRKKKSL